MEKSQIASTKFQINLKAPLDCARGDIVLGFYAFRYLGFVFWNLEFNPLGFALFLKYICNS